MGEGAALASMRPRHKAAESGMEAMITSWAVTGFNEAAA